MAGGLASSLFSSFSLPQPPPNTNTNNNTNKPFHELSYVSPSFLLSASPSISPLSFSISTRRPRTLFICPSSSSSDQFSSKFTSPDKKSVLADLMQEIEPLDVSLIQKDVPPTTLDAMKRTISGMLGLLPSDQFQVFIEALWEPLSKLLVSSMMTGYTLRNAEYRLCLERTIDIYKGYHSKQAPNELDLGFQGTASAGVESYQELEENIKFVLCDEVLPNRVNTEGLGEISLEAQQYILHLQSHLSSVKKELHEVRRKSAALQMQQFVGEEKNDLLDYLRSLEPEKVAELSEPTCPELKETIHSVVHGLLATLSPEVHSRTPPQSDNPSPGTLNIGSEDCAELVEKNSLQFQPLVSVSRDYLARLLFWCMLLGHHLRGLEYRMDLTELLSLTTNVENDDGHGDDQVA